MIVTSLPHVAAIVARFLKFPYVVLDTETKAFTVGKKDALVFGRARVTIWSLCYRGEAYSFPTSLFDPSFPTMQEYAKLFRPLFESKKIVKVAHNLKYDYHVFSFYDLFMCGPIWDTMIGAWAANENVEKGLKARAPLYGRFQNETKNVNQLDLVAYSEYAEQDVIVTDELYQMQMNGKVVRPKFIPHVVDKKGKFIVEFEENPMPVLELAPEGESLSPFMKHFVNLQELPVLKAAIRAEVIGVRFNQRRIKSIRKKIEKSLASVERKIYRMAGEPFNIGSTKKLVAVLQNLGLKFTKTTKSGAPSVNYEALHGMLGKHPIIALLVKFRADKKLLTTYASEKGLLHYCDEHGRIHCSMSTVGAITGRFSVSLPNLQQIPAAKDTYKIRSCFTS